MNFEPSITRGGTAELRNAVGELITAYCYEGFQFQPFCHPVNLPGEIPLTLSNPGDHPWHNGMYFSWKFLNGCNVWDFIPSDSGSIRHVAFECHPTEPSLRHEIVWCDSQRRDLLRDIRTLTVHPLAESPFAHAYDWHFHFCALADEVVCEREEKYGGYAGLGIRFARGGANSLLNAEGETDWPENWGDPTRFESRWVAYAFSLDGLPSKSWNANWGGMALFDHPSNPRHPTPWLTFNQIGMQKIMAAFLKKQPFVFQKNGTLDLRYRAVSFSGKPDRAALESLWSSWAGRSANANPSNIASESNPPRAD